MSNQDIKVLYLDDTCKINEYCILLKKYYFPLPTSRSITYDEIEKVTIGSSLNFNHKWGVATHDVKNWFPYDPNRKTKFFFIAFHLKGKKIIPSFTPVDAAKVFNIIQQNAAKHGFKHIVFEDLSAQQGNVYDHLVHEATKGENGEEISHDKFLSNTLGMKSTNQNLLGEKKE